MSLENVKNPYYYPRIDKEIVVYLHNYNIPQSKLAEEMGMAENTFSWKRRGVRDFILTEAIKLCRILGIDLRDALVAS